jgi:putative ABC transport system permease protein
MLTLTIKSIKAKKLRFVLTSVAVMLGVAFMAGTLVLTDTIKKNYDDVAVNVYEGTDAVVRSSQQVQGENGNTVRGHVEATLIEKVRAVAGVEAAAAQQLGIAVVVGHDGELVDANPNRSIPIAIGWQDSPELNPMEIVEGTAPRAADEIVIDRSTQKAGMFAVGERVRVVGPSGAHEYTLAGVATYGGADSAAGAQVVAFTPETAAQVFGTPGKVAAIQIVAAPGVSESQLAANLRDALTEDGVEVLTGAEATKDAQDETAKALQFVNIFLLTFAIVALVVGSFVIYNTFSITVAQRTKETALLRAIGARRRQVTRSVMLEALFTGVFASAIGVVAGLGLAQGLRAVLSGFGVDLPASSLVVNARAIQMSMVVGIVVTLLAAYLPARKAARVAPIEALRSVEAESKRGSKRRTVIGVLATAFGAFMIVQGLGGGGVSAVGMGALGVFVGVAMVGPVIARPFARALGWPLPRVRGMAGTLARENTARNPRRSSATASALMIGVGLVTLITIFASSARASISTTLDNGMYSNYIVMTQYGMGGLDPDVAEQIDVLPETGAVTPFRFVDVKVDETAKNISAFEPATIEQNVELDLRAGSIENMGLHDVAVQQREAEKHDVAVGDTVEMLFPDTGTQTMNVVAVIGAGEPFEAYSVSIEAFDAYVTTHVDDIAFVSNAPGVSMQESRRAIEAVLDDYPTAELLTKDEFKGEIASQINQMLNLVYVLLAMALVIAFFGIANTLALSVYERTRELGLLRAVGMSRRQLRSTVRWEAVLVAMLGTTLGTAIGVGFSLALIKATESEGIDQLAIPTQSLASIAVFAAVAAVVAAALPARRAARLDVLEAMSE